MALLFGDGDGNGHDHDDSRDHGHGHGGSHDHDHGDGHSDRNSNAPGALSAPGRNVAPPGADLPAHPPGLRALRHRRGWGSVLGGLLLTLVLLPPWPAAPIHRRPVPGFAPLPPALAGPVEWREVPASREGRQWWDAGSLRRDRRGQLSVLSRFQPPASDEPEPGAAEAAAKPGSLYVMELDCQQELYRDISVNGLPRWRAEWVPAAADSLSLATLQAACAAAGDATPPAAAPRAAAPAAGPGATAAAGTT